MQRDPEGIHPRQKVLYPWTMGLWRGKVFGDGHLLFIYLYPLESYSQPCYPDLRPWNAWLLPRAPRPPPLTCVRAGHPLRPPLSGMTHLPAAVLSPPALPVCRRPAAGPAGSVPTPLSEVRSGGQRWVSSVSLGGSLPAAVVLVGQAVSCQEDALPWS